MIRHARVPAARRLQNAMDNLLQSTAETPLPRCHNCGAALHGRFCSRCGQEDRPLDPSVREVVDEAAREITSLDSRILRSIRQLFLAPGFLTNEHLAGRRASWVSPVRLYLIFSVLYFALAAFTGSSALNFNIKSTGGDADTNQALRDLGFASEAELQRSVNTALQDWIPRAMFVLVPLFAWFVALVRRRSGRKYPLHVIFSLHVLAAFFGIQALAVALGAPMRGLAFVEPVLGILGAIVSAVYMTAAVRAVYGGTRGRALAHTLAVLFLYWIATILVAVAIAVPAVFSRRH
jgi:hypothetical protein